MEQQPLWFEDVYDALRHGVQACGGAKAVGHRLFPHKEPDAAGRYLMDCINPARQEKLDPEQLMALLRVFHEHGCHICIHYICRTAGYTTPEPVEPEDERAALQREFIQSVAQLRQLAAKIDQRGNGRA